MKAKKLLIRLVSMMLLFVLLCGIGTAEAGWQNDRGRWWYSFADGSYAKDKWIQDNDAWYYFDHEGYMVIGWKRIGGAWYYFEDSGRMATGWVRDGSNWYHFDSAGSVTTGWYQEGGKWYFFAKSGKMQTGWVQDGKALYYMDATGAMCMGWQKIGGSWFYFRNGVMCKGGETIDGKNYVFDANGRLVEGSYPTIFSIDLVNDAMGFPCAYIQILNQTKVAIDRVDFTIACYDAYGRKMKGFGMYKQDKLWYDYIILPGDKSPANVFWYLYGFAGVRTMTVTITKYHTTDGRTVNIPKSQQITFRN